MVRDKLLETAQQTLRERIERFCAVSSDLQRFVKLQHLLDRARRQGYWQASQRLLRRSETRLADLRYSLDRARQVLDMEQPKVLSLGELAGELDQIEDEFGDWDFDANVQELSVETEPVTLDGIYLGPFEIRLHLSYLCHMSRRQPFAVIALDPNPASSASHVTHPHVSDEGLCAGDATASLQNCLASGRLCDFFLIVRQVLNTYNAHSPYVALDQWEGELCPDCGYAMGDEDRFMCENCHNDFCSECISYCRSCDLSSCRECLVTCDHCDELNCRECMRTCSECGEPCCQSCLEDDLCPDCKQEQENSNEDQDQRQEKQQEAAPNPQAA